VDQKFVSDIAISRVQFSVFDSFRVIRVHIYDFLKFVGVKVCVANFLLGMNFI